MREENIIIATLAAVFLLALVFLYSDPLPQKTIGGYYPPMVEAANQKIWGVYAGSDDNLQEFESKIKKPVDVQAVFVGWVSENKFPSTIAASLKKQGKTLLIFWEAMDYNGSETSQPAFSYKTILSGKYDNYIKYFAQSAKNYGGPVIIVPFDEANGDWYPWSGAKNGNTPAQSAQAYRYLHKFFTGAANVKFGWAVNNDSVPDTAQNDIANYYPGADCVDYVGVDGFNFGEPWQTFSQVFGPTLAKLKTFKKPIFIFSMACAPGLQKAGWISDALSKIYSDPDIAGFVWFNENKEKNWLIWSSPQALKAFQSALP